MAQKLSPSAICWRSVSQVARDVAGPGDGGVALLAQVGRAGQVDHPLVTGDLALPFVDALRVQQRIGVDELRIEIAFGFLGVDAQAFFWLGLEGPFPVGLKGFGAVAPPGVDAVAEQALFGLLPVQARAVRAEGVIGGLVAQQEAVVFHFLPVGAAWTHNRPDGDHQAGIEGVQVGHHAVGVGEALGVKRLLPPQIAGPRLPVQHDAVERQLAAAVLPHDFDQLILRDVALFGLDIAKRPLGQHRRMPGQPADFVDDLVEFGAVEEVIVQLVVYSLHR